MLVNICSAELLQFSASPILENRISSTPPIFSSASVFSSSLQLLHFSASSYRFSAQLQSIWNSGEEKSCGFFSYVLENMFLSVKIVWIFQLSFISKPQFVFLCILKVIFFANKNGTDSRNVGGNIIFWWNFSVHF